jgi:hypothetical protein
MGNTVSVGGVISCLSGRDGGSFPDFQDMADLVSPCNCAAEASRQADMSIQALSFDQR